MAPYVLPHVILGGFQVMSKATAQTESPYDFGITSSFYPCDITKGVSVKIAIKALDMLIENKMTCAMVRNTV